MGVLEITSQEGGEGVTNQGNYIDPDSVRDPRTGYKGTAFREQSLHAISTKPFWYESRFHTRSLHLF